MAALGLAAVAVLSLGVATPLPQAHGAGELLLFEYEVDTLDAGTRDKDVFDTKCETAAGNCSLRAAIQQANFFGKDTPQIAVRITVKEGLQGVIEMPDDDASYAAALMTTESPAALNNGAYFQITRPMTIDLDGRLGVRAMGSAHPVAAFWVDGPKVVLTGFKDVFANQSSVVFGPTSDGSVLEKSEFLNSRNNFPRAVIRVRPGADDITIRSTKLGRSKLDEAGTDAYGGMIRLTPSSDPTDTTSPIKNLLIEDVTFDNTRTGTGGCTTSDATGCADTAIDTYLRPKLVNLVIRDCTFRHFPAKREVIDLSAVDESSSFTIEDNRFYDVQTGVNPANATIHLPLERSVKGPNYIQNNVFDNTGTSGQNHAIRWKGIVTKNPVETKTVDKVKNTPIGNNTFSNTFIEENEFNGYKGASIMLLNTGIVTTARNTFGTGSASQKGDTALEEEVGGTSDAMLLNSDATSNRRILGWFPTEPLINQDCELTVQVQQRWWAEKYGTYYYPFWPVRLDFYYTELNTAELYLGSVETNSSESRVKVPKLPPAKGYIRIQTQGIGTDANYPPTTGPANPESSQYSRTVAVDPGGCHDPELALDVQAWTGVAPDADSYAKISQGTKIPDNGLVPAGETVWITYTVTNTGRPPLYHVVVSDNQGEGWGCVIDKVSQHGNQSCWRRLTT
jgi:hypothetical protein